MSRTFYVVLLAMLIFTGGVAVQVLAENTADIIVGVIAQLVAIAIIIASVNGKLGGK